LNGEATEKFTEATEKTPEATEKYAEATEKFLLAPPRLFPDLRTWQAYSPKGEGPWKIWRRSFVVESRSGRVFATQKSFDG
jgi:hypothetical protein